MENNSDQKKSKANSVKSVLNGFKSFSLEAYGEAVSILKEATGNLIFFQISIYGQDFFFSYLLVKMKHRA
jgi:hypothetical protein